MKNKLKKWLSITLNIIVAFIIVIAVIFTLGSATAKKNEGLPVLLGYSPVIILDDSMKGDKNDSFSKGDLVVIKKTDANELKTNDIVSFWGYSDGRKVIFTYRIVKINNENSEIQFSLVGDNNPQAELVSKRSSDIVGVYKFKISGVGSVATFISTGWGFLLCLIIPLFLFFIWRLIRLVMAISNYRNFRNKATDEITINSDSDKMNR